MRSKSTGRPTSLGTLEEEVLHFVYSKGACTAEDCRGGLCKDRELRESTVRTVLSRLERKGLLRHDVVGRTFVYQPAELPQTLATRAVKQIIDRFCGGSVEQMLLGLVDNSMLGGDELKRISEQIAKRKNVK